MFHLVIARGKRCEYCKIIKSDNYEELSKYTTKFYNSIEIRENNKRVVNSFYNTYGTQGDIVIMNDELRNQRFRVLYKNDVKIAKKLIKSQNLMKYLVSNNILLVAPYDYKAIMYYKNNDYINHMKEFLKRRKDCYNVIRIIIRGYESYQKKHKELPSLYCLEKELMNSKTNNSNNSNNEDVITYDLNSDIRNEEFYNTVSDTLNNGNFEEVFNDYSIDDLVYYEDFKKLVKSGY